jgi:hypothetical protein
VLSEAWLVHIMFPRDKVRFRVKHPGGFGADHHGNVSTADDVEEVEHTSLLILQCFFLVLWRTVFEEDLPQGNVRQPRIPIPKLVLIRAVARRNERMFQKTFGRFEHAFVLAENIRPDDTDVVLRFSRYVGALRDERQTHRDQNQNLFHK